MVRYITASYTAYIDFKIPKGLPLLSMEENKQIGEMGIPFSWYIRWGSLYYFDADGKEQEIATNNESFNNKTPEIDNDEDDGEEYAEEEEEDDGEESSYIEEDE